jgi:hypothetical protein
MISPATGKFKADGAHDIPCKIAYITVGFPFLGPCFCINSKNILILSEGTSETDKNQNNQKILFHISINEFEFKNITNPKIKRPSKFESLFDLVFLFRLPNPSIFFIAN